MQINSSQSSSKSPTVSIILPSYNYAQYVRQAIDSVLAQTFTNWELIIIDDGSTDLSQKIIQSYAEKYSDKIRVVFFETNTGLPNVIKHAVSIVRAEFIAFLEADDVWVDTSLEIKVLALQNTNAVVAFTNVTITNDSVKQQKKLSAHVDSFTRIIRPDTEINMSWAFAVNSIPTFSCAITRKPLLSEVDFNIPKSSQNRFDHWVWSQLSLKGTFYYIPQALTIWRAHTQSFSYKKLRVPFRQFRNETSSYAQALFGFVPSPYKIYLRNCWEQFSTENLSQQTSFLKHIAILVESERFSKKIFWKALIFVKDSLEYVIRRS